MREDPFADQQHYESSEPAAESARCEETVEPILAWLSDEADRRQAPTESPGDAAPIYQAEVVDEYSYPAALPRRRRPRRRALPIILFLATCCSTFLVGACAWLPAHYLLESWHEGSFMPLRRVLVSHWQDGLLYMGCVLAILLTHEMGHFLATLRYRIPASLPYFLPLPIISPIGTLGAVIGMEGSRANRREIFDIGIAGPLAGLVVAIPVMWIGVAKLDFTRPEYGVFQLDAPLLVRFMLDYLQPAGYTAGQRILHGHLNPYFMAGWVGLLVTGLNMMPVSQLDGGHVLYTLLGRRAHWVARGCIVLAIAYSFYAWTPVFVLMVVLIMLVGPDHPPTRDDSVPLGWFRTVLGVVSALAIPVLCFAPRMLIIFPN